MTKNSKLSAPAASPSVTVRFGFGEFDLSTLKEDEFVTASGLNDGGWVVCKRLPSTPEETGPSNAGKFPITLNAAQEEAVKGSALSYNLFADTHVAEFNLRTFARLIISRGAAPSSVTPPQHELEHMKSQRDYLQRVCSKIQIIVSQSDLPDRSSELDVLPSSVAILAARASSPSSATERDTWISVDEKLPAANWYGLFITNENFIELGYFRDDPEEKPCWVCERTAPQDETIKYVNQDGQVTHWRELPKPPSSAGTPQEAEATLNEARNALTRLSEFLGFEGRQYYDMWEKERKRAEKAEKALSKFRAERGVPLEEKNGI